MNKILNRMIKEHQKEVFLKSLQLNKLMRQKISFIVNKVKRAPHPLICTCLNLRRKKIQGNLHLILTRRLKKSMTLIKVRKLNQMMEVTTTKAKVNQNRKKNQKIQGKTFRFILQMMMTVAFKINRVLKKIYKTV